MLTVIIIAVWGAIGNYMVYFIAGLTGISDDIYESAKIDGANETQSLFYITIPMLAPIIKMILMLALVVSFLDMQSILVLTEGGPMMLPMLCSFIFISCSSLYLRFNGSPGIPGTGAAVTL